MQSEQKNVFRIGYSSNAVDCVASLDKIFWKASRNLPQDRDYVSIFPLLLTGRNIFNLLLLLAYQFLNTSASNAKMVPRGLKTLIGAHGEPPMGLNYHYEMFFTQQGGLSNYEVCICDLSLSLDLPDLLFSRDRFYRQRHRGLRKCMGFSPHWVP